MTHESESINLVETVGEIAALLDRAWECTGEGALELAESAERLLAGLQVRALQTPFSAADVVAAEPSLSSALHQNEEDFRAFLAHVGSHPDETSEHFGMARFRCHILRRLIRVVYGRSPQDQLPFLLNEGRTLERQLSEGGGSEEPLPLLYDFQTEILRQRATHLLKESTALTTQSDVDQIGRAHV